MTAAQSLCGHDPQPCLAPEGGVDVLLAVMDLMLHACSSGGGTAAGAAPMYVAIFDEAISRVQSSCKRIFRYVEVSAGLKPRLAAALLSSERLLGWFGCLPQLAATAAADVMELLVSGIAPTAHGAVATPASDATEVGVGGPFPDAVRALWR
jgi:hypothetical protein